MKIRSFSFFILIVFGLTVHADSSELMTLPVQEDSMFDDPIAAGMIVKIEKYDGSTDTFVVSVKMDGIADRAVVARSDLLEAVSTESRARFPELSAKALGKTFQLFFDLRTLLPNGINIRRTVKTAAPKT